MKLFVKSLGPNYPILDLLKGTSRFNESDVFGLIDDFLAKKETEADAYLIAHDAIHFGHNKKNLVRLIELSKVKPVILFDCGDYPLNLKLNNVISLRNSFPPNDNFSNVISIPYNVKSRSHLPIREFTETPTISFVGFAPSIISRRLIPKSLSSISHPIINNGSIVRFLGIRKISQFGNKILILRKHYGGARSLIGDLSKFESEYENSILNSDLVFTPRGDANQSARFFEVLSAGRIPIIPNTSIVMPHLISSDFSPRIIAINPTSSDLKVKIEEFWKSINPESWRKIQMHNRAVFEDHYDFRVFISKLFSSTYEQLLTYVLNAKS